MAAHQQLWRSLDVNAAQQQVLKGKISEVEAKIADLNTQIADAMRREAILARQIDAERAQLRQLSHAIYVAPGSVLVVLGESQSLSDLITRISDLNVDGARAREIKGRLTPHLYELQTVRHKDDAARAGAV